MREPRKPTVLLRIAVDSGASASVVLEGATNAPMIPDRGLQVVVGKVASRQSCVPFQRAGKTFNIVIELPGSAGGVLAPLGAEEVEPELVNHALDLDEQAQEDAVPLARRKPKDPTEAVTEEEKRQHEVLHEPFRTWSLGHVLVGWRAEVSLIGILPFCPGEGRRCDREHWARL
eukprot:1315104-Amphidinium_carterae.2